MSDLLCRLRRGASLAVEPRFRFESKALRAFAATLRFRQTQRLLRDPDVDCVCPDNWSWIVDYATVVAYPDAVLLVKDGLSVQIPAWDRTLGSRAPWPIRSNQDPQGLTALTGEEALHRRAPLDP